MAKRKRIYRSRVFWEDVVAKYEVSGMSQAAFARSIKVNPNSLNNWIVRFRKESAQNALQFVEVVPSPSVPCTAPTGPTATRIVVKDVAVEFCDLPPVTYVAALLREVVA